MSGNVWEMCEDWYGEYEEGDLINPHGRVIGECLVLRGNSWYNEEACVSIRIGYKPERRGYDYGFRLTQ